MANKLLLVNPNFFGLELGWSPLTATIVLIVVEALIAALIISLIVYFILARKMKRRLGGNKSDPERELMGLSLELGEVQRQFKPGDPFNCDGLVVNAEYSKKPILESLEYSLVDAEAYEKLVEKGKADGVYVVKPDMNKLGKTTVHIKYEGQTVVGYTISIKEHVDEPVKTPEPAASAEPTTIVVEASAEEKREMTHITLNTDNVKKEFYAGDALDHEGLIVTAHYNLEPLEEEVTNFSVIAPDMDKEGKPTVTVSYQRMAVGYQITINPAPDTDEPTVEKAPVVVQPIIVEEESAMARLRYDKSFEARVIQSDDDTKNWYTELKNDLLSYKGAKGRVSWKRETFKCQKEVVAKLAYRGKTLCIFLPLDPAKYVDNHRLENASDTSCYEDTPVMIRLKNQKRVKLAMQLYGEIMEKMGVPRQERELVDYYVPYEGIMELINRGLIKREIKAPEEEAIFERDKPNEGGENANDGYELQKIAPGVYVTRKD